MVDSLIRFFESRGFDKLCAMGAIGLGVVAVLRGSEHGSELISGGFAMLTTLAGGPSALVRSITGGSHDPANPAA